MLAQPANAAFSKDGSDGKVAAPVLPCRTGPLPQHGKAHAGGGGSGGHAAGPFLRTIRLPSRPARVWRRIRVLRRHDGT